MIGALYRNSERFSNGTNSGLFGFDVHNFNFNVKYNCDGIVKYGFFPVKCSRCNVGVGGASGFSSFVVNISVC